MQTTRARIRGVAIEGETPDRLRRHARAFSARAAGSTARWSPPPGAGAADADVVVLLIEAHRGITEGVERILETLAERRQGPQGRAGHQQDRPGRIAETLLALTKEMNERLPFAETFMISAEKGHGVDDLRAWLAGELPEGPWLYPEDQIADLPMRMIAAEITREKLTLRLHQELPYQLTVETENWEEREDGSARIDQLIYVTRDGHKGIVLGHKGETIKAVGARPPAPSWRSSWAARCTCSCRSRCARTGWRRPSAIPRWASTSRTAMS